MYSVAKKLTKDEIKELYNPQAKDLKPGDVIYGIVTDYPSESKILAVIKLTSVAHRGDKVRLFGQRLTTKDVGREWSTTYIPSEIRYEIPF